MQGFHFLQQILQQYILHLKLVAITFRLDKSILFQNWKIPGIWSIVKWLYGYLLWIFFIINRVIGNEDYNMLNFSKIMESICFRYFSAYNYIFIYIGLYSYKIFTRMHSQTLKCMCLSLQAKVCLTSFFLLIIY